MTAPFHRTEESPVTSVAGTRADDDAGETGLVGAQRKVAVACVLAALVLVVLDAAIANVALFAVASALCAFAPSLSLLFAARFLQGLGGAAIMSRGVALLRFVVPQRELGTAIGWNAPAVALASAAGPTVCAIVARLARTTGSQRVPSAQHG